MSKRAATKAKAGTAADGQVQATGPGERRKLDPDKGGSAGPQIIQQPPLLFECAWEVCWQLGGIYTVLRTKAATMVERWGDRYCLIGPYNPNTAPVEFEEQPTYGSIRETLQKLRDSGMQCYFGRWPIPGRPRVILLDYRALRIARPRQVPALERQRHLDVCLGRRGE